jgi:hypothetical protein
MNKFRTLGVDEIDCRVNQIRENGLTILLYKDARCDQNILDETVGPMNWQRFHSRDNANCTVQIWDTEKQQWVSKEDVGTPSNTEADKGLASDSFKRACFNWGIGRELYSAPFIFIPANKCNIKTGRNGKPACYDHFRVAEIGYRPDGARDICKLVIANDKTGAIVYSWSDTQVRPVQQEVAADAADAPQITPMQKASRRPEVEAFCLKHGLSAQQFGDFKTAAVQNEIIRNAMVNDLTDTEFADLLKFVEMNLQCSPS